MIETTKFTPRALQVVNHAQQEAEKNGSSYASTEHLLLAMLAINAGIGATVLKRLGVTYENVQQAIRQELYPDET